MQRIIPKSTRVKFVFWRNITLIDIIIALAFIGIVGLILGSSLPYNYVFAIAILIIGITLFLKSPTSDDRAYVSFVYFSKFIIQAKHYSIANDKKTSISYIIPKVKFKDCFIKYSKYSALVVEIDPVDFGTCNEDGQDYRISFLSSALKNLQTTQKAQIVKIVKPLILDTVLVNQGNIAANLIKLKETNQITEEELNARFELLQERVSFINSLNNDEKIAFGHYYLVVYDSDESNLYDTVEYMRQLLSNGNITSYILRDEELAVFWKSQYTNDFDEREAYNEEIDLQKWVIPKKIDFSLKGVTIDNKKYSQLAISDFPIMPNPGNAWAHNIFNPQVKRRESENANSFVRIVMNLTPIDNRIATKRFDKTIQEMQSQIAGLKGASAHVDNEMHVESLGQVLVDMKSENEMFFDVSIIVTCDSAVKKNVVQSMKMGGFNVNDMFGRQLDTFVSSNISQKEVVKNIQRGIHSSSIAAAFPFTVPSMIDDNGFFIGFNSNYPVLIDFFKRDARHTNSNFMIIGKTGGGKSYTSKLLESNFSTDNCKIFTLDPHNEYSDIAKALKGKNIDVGAATEGRMNPFHIPVSLKEEGESDFHLHLQFLEQFFREILGQINNDAFELLNSCLAELYKKKGINEATKVKDLRPENFPIFNDLIKIVDNKLEIASKGKESSYIADNLRIIKNYIAKYGDIEIAGSYSNLWNGPSTITTKENVINFNFEKLFANNNRTVASAQMLLVTRYLENEIISNAEFNKKNGTNRKIIVLIDEAHNFINAKNPVALDFMNRLAKEIRKYSGALGVITQNVKDFLGATPEVKQKSTAVINNMQYSFILPLQPNDVTELINLYKDAGGLNAQETFSITNNPLGTVFLISSPSERTNINIVALPKVRKIIDPNPTLLGISNDRKSRVFLPKLELGAKDESQTVKHSNENHWQSERKETEYIKQKDEYIELVKASVECFVKTQKKLKCPEGLSKELYNTQAGVFVSIKNGEAIRGHLGTLASRKSNIAEEIIEYATRAACDPKFPPIAKNELENLRYSVDILLAPEPIKNKNELDLNQYGVIVRYKKKMGASLLALDKVKTIEEQISTALKKAGIKASAPYNLERFEIVRHE